MSADVVLPHVWANQPLSSGTLVWLSVILAVAAFVLIIGGVMGHCGRLRPNRVVGIRTVYTESSHRAWYDVHAKAAPWLVASGAALITGIVVLNLTNIPRVQFLALVTSIGVGTAVLLIGTRFAHSAARQGSGNDQSAEERERTL